MAINSDSTIEEVAANVSEALSRAEFSAVLSGGAVVSIYTDNEYESKDLDFGTSEPIDRIADVSKEVGFTKTTARYFVNDDTDYYIEFQLPTGPR